MTLSTILYWILVPGN